MTTLLPVIRQFERTQQMFRRAEWVARLPFSDPAAPALRHLALLERLAVPTFALPNFWRKPNLQDHPALLYAPGELRGDLILAWLGDEGALDRLAQRIPWRLHGTDEEKRIMRAELGSRAESTGRGHEQVKHAALMAGLTLALGEREREQRHRFGQQWVVESAENHRGILFVPRDARPRWYWRWLCDEAVKAAQADLLGKPYPRSEMRHDVYDRTLPKMNAVTEKPEYRPAPPDSLDREGAPDPIDTSSDPLTVLLVDERWQEAAGKLQGLLAHAPPGRAAQELLPLLMEQLQTRQEPNFAEIERTLGLKPGTSRQRFFRYRQQVKKVI